MESHEKDRKGEAQGRTLKTVDSTRIDGRVSTRGLFAGIVISRPTCTNAPPLSPVQKLGAYLLLLIC